MAKEVRLPQLGQTMEEGTIVSTLVAEGDRVDKGDVLFEIETDKATLEMESPASGVVKKILIADGETIPVNSPMVVLGEEDEEITQEYINSLMADTPGRMMTPEAVPVQSEPAAPAPASVPAAPPASGSVEAPPSAKVVRLPQLGQTMEEGTIVTVLIKEGDAVDKGDVIFEVETDKATLEMESPAAGIVKAILVEEGETIPVNNAILILADSDTEISQAYIDSVKSGGQVAPAAQSAPGTSPAPTAAPETRPATSAAVSGGRVFASPRAKMVAADLGVDLNTVPTPPGSARITEADVRAAAKGGTVAPAPTQSLGQKVPVNRLQKIVGQRMLTSKNEIPCFYLNIKVDMTELVKLRAKLKKNGVKVSFNDFIIRAVALGLNHYPIMTGQLAGDFIQLADSIDIGLAIAGPKGLVAPIVKDCFNKTTTQIATYGKGLIDRTRSEKLSMDDLEGGCITVSNLGGFGIDSFIPIVVPGQCSILGVGRIADTCVPMEGNIMIRKIMNLNLSVDHKVANGADAAQFLDFVKKTLEHVDNFTE